MTPTSIGGALVRRRFNMGGRDVRPGETLSRDQIMSMPGPNRSALIDSGFLDVFPEATSGIATMPCHVVHRGMGKYDVIWGRVLNEQPLSKEDADALAAAPKGQG